MAISQHELAMPARGISYSDTDHSNDRPPIRRERAHKRSLVYVLYENNPYHTKHETEDSI